MKIILANCLFDGPRCLSVFRGVYSAEATTSRRFNKHVHSHCQTREKYALVTVEMINGSKTFFLAPRSLSSHVCRDCDSCRMSTEHLLLFNSFISFFYVRVFSNFLFNPCICSIFLLWRESNALEISTNNNITSRSFDDSTDCLKVRVCQAITSKAILIFLRIFPISD